MRSPQWMTTFCAMIHQARPQVFTLGYQQRSLREYVEQLQLADVDLVVDVRETAWSHKPGFSKARLAQQLEAVGIGYLHLKFAGNPKELRRTATSHAQCLAAYDRHIQEAPEIIEQFAFYVASWAEEGIRACLLCYERHPDDCHRAVLLNRVTEVLEAPVEVKHLGPEGADRLS